MNLYPFKILSPKAKIHHVLAQTEFHAIQLAVINDGYQYSNAEYTRIKVKQSNYKQSNTN